MFVLNSVIESFLSTRKRLYCCFVDFTRAFDTVNRQYLWYKLRMQGVGSKLLKIIQSLYHDFKACVKWDDKLSELIAITKGVLQGEALSPVLFSLFINDIVKDRSNSNDDDSILNMLNIFLIMYADDIVVLAASPAKLQKKLHSLHTYCNTWQLSVNVDKTKVVVFRNGGTVNDTWSYNRSNLKIVDSFNYLGIHFFYNGKFRTSQKTLAEQGRKAMFGILKSLSDITPNTETKLYIFDKYVKSILCYACEVWGFHSANDVEKIHLNFCKKVLGVNNKATTCMVYGELGRFPLVLCRKIRILKYWAKLVSSENVLMKTMYNHMFNSMFNKSWIVSVRDLLNNIGLGEFWINQSVPNISSFVANVTSRLQDQCIQLWREEVESKPKCILYQHLVDTFNLQFYLVKTLQPTIQKAICKLRISSHYLAIESGRYNNTPRPQRMCTVCNSNEIEDEFHFLLICDLYTDIRKTLIKKYYYIKPSVFKLVQLLSTNNVKELRNLGTFIVTSLNARECKLSGSLTI